MAVIQKGLDAAVSSWSNNTSLVGSGRTQASYSVFQTSERLDTTPLSPTNDFAEVRHGLRSWGGSFISRLTTATQGVVNGSVTWGTYSTNVRAWRLTVEADPIDTTDLAAAGRWRTSKPGLLRAFGTIECFIDDAAGVDIPLVGATDGSEATLTLQLATSNTIAGSASIFEVPYTIAPRDDSIMTLGFEMTGSLTAAGSSNFFPAGTIAKRDDPSSDTITLTHDASGTKNVSGAAWWQSVTVNVDVNSIVTAEVNFIGTGALAST